MIGLRSDTVTLPNDEMRAAARDAPVGDDVYREDPTVNELQERAAEILGTESALFVPSGTMDNQVAARIHTERGQERARTRHAGPGARWLREGERPSTRDGLLTLENTHNSKGGTALSPAALAVEADAAHELDVPIHLDGARLFNAAAAHDRPAEAFLDDCESGGVLGVPFDDRVVRFCMHWDVTDGDVEEAIAAIERAA